MNPEFHPLSPQETRARLNGVSDYWRDQLAASAIAMAQARHTQNAPKWRQRIIETYKRVRGLTADQERRAA